jgi:hypothetical protein
MELFRLFDHGFFELLWQKSMEIFLKSECSVAVTNETSYSFTSDPVAKSSFYFANILYFSLNNCYMLSIFLEKV